MVKGARFILGLVLVLMLSGTAFAQAPITPQHSDAAWQAAYWNNPALSGNPVVSRQDMNIDFNWGTGSPDGALPVDGFSARWSRHIDVAPGVYRFTATADDGVRVWVDGELIINQWYDHAAATYTADRNLGAGHHLVIVEYYENMGLATARVNWAQATPAVQYWRGEYYDNTYLGGVPAMVRDDVQINFNWGNDSPATGLIGADGFSARWTRTVNLAAGWYTFAATSDDGIRVWVNQHLLIDAWYDRAPQTNTGRIYLPGGATSLKVEYYENVGGAVARFSWSGDQPGPPPANGLVVDDLDAGFTRGGSATGWHGAAEGYAGHLTWTRNNQSAQPDYNWARWYPTLAAGRYEVFVFIPAHYASTTSARYWVSHADGFTQRIVNQSVYAAQWVSLGTYAFRGTRSDYVSLSDVTYEPYLSRYIGFDAVKWEPR